MSSWERLNRISLDSQFCSQAISSVKRNGCALKGNIASRDDDLSGNRSFNVEIRDTLDLFVNVVKIQSQPGVKTRHQDIDMVLVRQNTEGMQYFYL